MTTRQRIDLISHTYPQLFSRSELHRMVSSQLGHVDALDHWILHDGVRVQARAPKLIYHICAGNLAVSAWTSIVHGLVLGAYNLVKLPGDRHDSSVRREIADFIHGLPAPLRKLIKSHRGQKTRPESVGRTYHNTLPWDRDSKLEQADAVIAFGSDETMANIRTLLRRHQKFIAHGHAVSFLWLADPNKLTSREARACATDVLTYDQLGCLSPQAIYVPPKTDIKVLGEKLSHALEAHWHKLAKKPTRPLGVAARIAEARDMAHALGHRVWLPPKKHLGWTLIHDSDPAFQPSPLHGVIYLRQVSEKKIETALASVSGQISTIGVAGRISSPLEKAFLNLGVSRFCPAGRMQFPPLSWHHDGHSTLAELVTWIDVEGTAEPSHGVRRLPRRKT